MPVEFIKLPAKMKNGTASNGKLCVAVTIFWMATVGGMVPVSTKTGIEASIRANATGMPISRKSANRPVMSNSIRRRPCCEDNRPV